MKKQLLLCLLISLPMLCYAQRPKLYLKAYGGYNFHRLVYREAIRSSDSFNGWHAGLGMRLSYRKVFAEMDLEFLRTGTTVALEDSINSPNLSPFEVRLNALQIPMKAGYVLVSKSFFKWFVQTGLQIDIHLNGELKQNGEETKVSPKDINLKRAGLNWLLGTQFDFWMFNAGINYGLAITNSTRTDTRTNSHELKIHLGVIF